MDESDGKVMAGALLLLAGAILGAGVALLVAPQSGRETRKDISRQMKKTRRKVEGAAGEFAESVSGMVDAIEKKAEELLDQGMDLAKDSKEAVLEVVEDGQERLARQRDRLAKLLG
jgi:gas vesicle protein